MKIELAKNSEEKIYGIEISEFALLLKNKKKNVWRVSSDVHIDNLLSYFFHLSGPHKRKLYQSKFQDSHVQLIEYKLIEDTLQMTENGIKLFVYLERNPHLIEYEGIELDEINVQVREPNTGFFNGF